MRICIIALFLLTGCLGIKYTRPLNKAIKTNFTNRLEGTNTGLSKKINIGGIYRYYSINEVGLPEKFPNRNDTLFTDFLFYEDGTLVWNIWYSQEFKNYEDYFKAINIKGQNDIFYKAHWWGVYTISNDTIKTQYLMHAAPGTPWYAGEKWYLIKNSSTLQLIFSADLDELNSGNGRNDDKEVGRAKLAHFVPFSQIPPPLGWIKKEKFFWRYELDYANYMKSNAFKIKKEKG